MLLKTICKYCEEEFEYNSMDEYEVWDEDYEGNIITLTVVHCPYCASHTKV